MIPCVHAFYWVPDRFMPPGLNIRRYERPLAERRLPGRHLLPPGAVSTRPRPFCRRPNVPSPPGRHDAFMDTAVPDYLDDLVATARGILGPNFVGAYATGSIALQV